MIIIAFPQEAHKQESITLPYYLRNICQRALTTPAEVKNHQQ